MNGKTEERKKERIEVENNRGKVTAVQTPEKLDFASTVQDRHKRVALVLGTTNKCLTSIHPCRTPIKEGLHTNCLDFGDRDYIGNEVGHDERKGHDEMNGRLSALTQKRSVCVCDVVCLPTTSLLQWIVSVTANAVFS